MLMECNIKAIVILVSVSMIGCLLSCNRRASFAGVEKHWMSGGYHSLVVERNGVTAEVVPADVKWVRVKGRLVYGYIESYTYSDGVSSKTGYFVYDTGSSVLVDALSQERQKELLLEEVK